MTPFKKRIGAERTLLMIPLNIVMTGHVQGPLAGEQLFVALEKLRARHRQLAVRVVLEADGTGWYTDHGVPPVPVSVHERTNEKSWLKQVTREYQKPFPIETGPLVRCALVRGETESEVILTAHHAVCDGYSLTLLLRDLLHTVAHPEQEVEVLPAPPPIDHTTVPNPPKTGLLMGWILGAMNKKWIAEGHQFGEQEMIRLHDLFWKKNQGVELYAWEFDQQTTALLVDRCRREQVTVNSALWCAFLLAQRDVQTDSQAHRKRSALAISTRDKLSVEVGETLGFYASSLTVMLPVGKNGGFWEAARAVHKKIRRGIAKTNLFRMLVAESIHPTLLDSLYFEKYGMIRSKLAFKLLKKMGWHKLTYGYALTNVGKMEVPDTYGELRLTSVFGPSFYSDVEEKMVGVVTVGGKLTMTLTANSAVIGAGTARSLKERATSTLLTACKA